MQRDGLSIQAFRSVRYGYIRPEFNGGDAGHGEVDDYVMRAAASVKIMRGCIYAAASVKTETAGERRFVPVIPRFSRGNDEYRKVILDGRTDTTRVPTRLNGILTRKAAVRRERGTYNT